MKNIGVALRSLRTARSLSLAEVSAVTGISVSTLSRLETGQRSPHLDYLVPLARLYKVSLHDLGLPETGDPRIHAQPQRRSDSTVIPLTRYPAPQQAFKMVLPASRNEPKLVTHEGREWLYVLSGTLRLLLDCETYLLAQAKQRSSILPDSIGSAAQVPRRSKSSAY
ncbi:helix-turn-helix domain-containing protein [Corynebacterium epidermidicanis]|nr:XRE family transcriptional regulator [Corynebacterium epidermidicanis]